MWSKILLSTIKQLFVIIIFCLSAFGVIFLAYGYKWDFDDSRVIKTSVVHLEDKLSNVSVFLNGKLVANRLPAKIFEVPVGYHELKIERDGFIPWKRNISVAYGFATKLRDLKLIPVDLSGYTTLLSEGVDLYAFTLDKENLLIFERDMAYLKVIYKAGDNFEFRIFEDVSSDLLDLNCFLPNQCIGYLPDNNFQIIDLKQGVVDTFKLNKEYTDIVFSDIHGFKGYALHYDNLVAFNRENSLKNFILMLGVDYFVKFGDFIYALQDNKFWEVDLIHNIKRNLLSIENAKTFKLDYFDSKIGLALFDSGELFIVPASGDDLILADKFVSGFDLSDEAVFYTKGYEIRSYFDNENKLITRFGQSLSGIKMYNNGNILFLKNGELFICDTVGANCHYLNRAKDYEIIPAWDEVIVFDSGNVYALTF